MLDEEPLFLANHILACEALLNPRKLLLLQGMASGKFRVQV